MPDVQQSFSTSIEAPLGLCYAAIGDFEAYPTWSSPITSIKVLERHPDGQAKRVEFVVDMKLRSVRYVLEYTWHPPDRLTWKMVEGDLADIEGSYVFGREAPNRTTATCSQGISLGFWVPSLILRPIEQTALRQSVLEFKTEAERLAKRARRKKA
jgi:uncharacterized membrane protein